MVKNELHVMTDYSKNFEDITSCQDTIPTTARDILYEDEPWRETQDETPLRVREHLKTVIYKKRQASGDLDFSFDEEQEDDATERKEDLSPEDVDRIKRRRYLNKQAAQRCRDKKKDRAQELTGEVYKLEARNTELRHSVRKLTRETEELRTLLMTHFELFHGGGAPVSTN